jgi:PKD repeat protein
MKRTLSFARVAAQALLIPLVAVVSGCTMKSQDPPSLTGPSEFGVAITMEADSTILVLDGADSTRVVVTARDAKGKPKSGVNMRSQIFFDRQPVDFGSLSQRTLSTNSDGVATLRYTAPVLTGGVDNGLTVVIAVTPMDAKDFDNESTRSVTIRLVPPGVVIPADGLKAAFTFTPSAPSDHQVVLFDASTSTAPANNPIASYSWNFGDGSTGSGRTATHSFNTPGTYAVTLSISDGFNRTATATQTVDVAGGTAPTASFLFSPSAPKVGENVNFNASASRPATGRTIRSYDWDFGDGEQKSTTTPITTHDYQKAGDFTVTLVVTDDAGRVAVANTTVTIGSDAPTADFTFAQLPISALNPHTIQFSSATSTVAAGRTITSYFWDFGDTTTSPLAGPTHNYAGAASYNVTLTITDSAGKTGRVTKTVQVQ